LFPLYTARFTPKRLRALLEASTVADMAEVIIQHLARQTDQEDLARLTAEVEALSEEEVTRRLTDEGA
jgi:hypothetical protein